MHLLQMKWKELFLCKETKFLSDRSAYRELEMKCEMKGETLCLGKRWSI